MAESNEETEKNKDDKKVEKKKMKGSWITKEIVHTIVIFAALIACLMTRYIYFSFKIIN